MPRTDILFVRHADVHNPDNVFYARLSRFRLSEQGLKGAEITAQALAEEPLAAIYTSPMLRAKQTARIIAKQHPGVPLRVTRRLIELRTHFQGQQWAKMPRHPNYYDAEAGDETVQQVFLRMQRLMFDLIAEYPGRSVLCVSHGDPIKILRMAYLGQPLTKQSAGEPDPARGSILRFGWQDGAGEPEITYFEPHTGRHLAGYWERVGSLAALPEGVMKPSKLEGQPVLLARVDGQVFVMANHCGHMRTLLHQGILAGKTVTCPLHGSQYDLESGKVLREAQLKRPLRSVDGQALEKLTTEPRRTFDVRLEGDAIFARIR
ncbi:MAG TPA: histidine phosphatase family protein [Chloroflexota bacterium]|nr:histidine phosphatase family protein [Chloroflexota bacterium]